DHIAGFEIRNEGLIRIAGEEVFYGQVHIALLEDLQHTVECFGRRNYREQLGAGCVKHSLSTVIIQLYLVPASFEIHTQLIRPANRNVASGEVGDDLTIASQVFAYSSSPERECLRVANWVGDRFQYLEG